MVLPLRIYIYIYVCVLSSSITIITTNIEHCHTKSFTYIRPLNWQNSFVKSRLTPLFCRPGHWGMGGEYVSCKYVSTAKENCDQSQSVQLWSPPMGTGALVRASEWGPEAQTAHGRTLTRVLLDLPSLPHILAYTPIQSGCTDRDLNWVSPSI